MKEIKKIDPMSSGRLTGVLSAVMGIIFGIIYGLMIGIMAIVSRQYALAIIGIVILIAAPIFYGLFGFLWGLFVAFIYNIIANKFGGIKIELK